MVDESSHSRYDDDDDDHQEGNESPIILESVSMRSGGDLPSSKYNSHFAAY